MKQLGKVVGAKSALAGFAAQYRLNMGRDEVDNTEVVLGMDGAIYEHGDGAFTVMFIPIDGQRTRLWHSYRQKCLTAGMTLLQDGDAEGAFRFDPHDQAQSNLAIKVAGVKREKSISDEHRAKLLVASVRFTGKRTSLQSTSVS